MDSDFLNNLRDCIDQDNPLSNILNQIPDKCTNCGGALIPKGKGKRCFVCGQEYGT